MASHIFLGFGRTYHTNIQFEYIVDGRKIAGNRIQYGIGGRTFIFKSFASRIVERYPVGKTTAIHYNPDNAEDEVVELAPVVGFSFLWIVLSVISLGSAVLITARKSSFQSEHAAASVYRSLRPPTGVKEGDIKGFYPTQIYNPKNSDDNQQTNYTTIRKKFLDSNKQCSPYYPKFCW